MNRASRRKATRAVAALAFGLMTAGQPARADAVRDDLGRPVEVVGALARVATLSPFLTETVAAIGALGQIVAVSEFSDFPPYVKRLPTVSNAAGISWERLVAVRPDIVLAWKDSLREGDLARFEAAGLKVFVLSGRRLDDVPRTMRTLAAFLGRNPPPAVLAFEDRIKALREANAGKRALRALVEVSFRPLLTIGGEHFVNDTLALCGARNAFADLPGVAPEVPWERVLKDDPAVIIGAGAAPGQEAFRARWREHASLAAVKSGALVYLEADHFFRPGPRLAEGATALCRALDAVRAPG